MNLDKIVNSRYFEKHILRSRENSSDRVGEALLSDIPGKRAQEMTWLVSVSSRT